MSEPGVFMCVMWGMLVVCAGVYKLAVYWIENK